MKNSKCETCNDLDEEKCGGWISHTGMSDSLLQIAVRSPTMARRLKKENMFLKQTAQRKMSQSPTNLVRVNIYRTWFGCLDGFVCVSSVEYISCGKKSLFKDNLTFPVLNPWNCIMSFSSSHKQTFSYLNAQLWWIGLFLLIVRDFWAVCRLCSGRKS